MEEKLFPPDKNSREIGVYIHVPFCASKCGYCDFYSRVDDTLRDMYIKALAHEITCWKDEGLRAGTVFFGGGTPSLLSAGELEAIFSALNSSIPVLPEAEITLEANPETVDVDFLRAAKALGINRISFGVQSASDRELKALGRIHTFSRAEKAFYDARAAGFDNISLDLMLGIPYQTDKSLAFTIKRILGLKPEHISGYLLKIEEGTPFYRENAGRLCADDDEAAELYLLLCGALKNAGYSHYEISNFAVPSFESRHNLKYWRDEPYLGFGPAAHSCFGGKRFYNPPELERYIKNKGRISKTESREGIQGLGERMMLAMRLKEGFDLSDNGASGMSGEIRKGILSRAAPYISAGLILYHENRLSFTERGMLVSNALLSEILP